MNCEICGERYVLILQNSINDDMTETKYRCEKCDVVRFVLTERKKDTTI